MKLKTKALLTILFSVIYLPAHLAKVDYRNLVIPTKIFLDKQSPAYVAWEDAELNKISSIVLAAVEAEKISSESEQLSTGRALIQKIKSKQILIISEKNKNDNNTIYAQKTSEATQLTPIIINKYTQITNTKNLAKNMEWGSTFNTHNYNNTENTEIIDYKSLGQKLVQDELEKRSLMNSNLKEIPSSRGGTIIVSKGFDAKNENEANAIKYFVAKSKTKANESNETNKIEKRVDNNGNDKIVVAGFTGLSHGAAFLDNKHTINAYHVVDGKTYAHTQVNSSDGSYQIETDNDSGEIVAELVSPNGDVIAIGSRPLVLSQRKKSNEYLLNLDLHPVTNALLSRVVYGALEPRQTAENAKLTINGLERKVSYNREAKQWTDKSFIAGSELVLKATNQNHYPTIKQSKVGREQIIKLFPNSYIETLKEIIFGKDNISQVESMGTIIGEVVSRGFPVSGAKISIIGEEIKPVYFSGYIPDIKLDTTSQNGAFAFAAISAEDKILNIKMGEYAIWPILVSTYFKTVTQLDIEIDTPISATWKSFDAFSGEPVPTVLSSLGAEISFATDANGYASHALSVSSGLSFVESDSNIDYLALRTQINFGQSEVKIPQFKTEWINQLLGKKPESEEARKRMLIGRVIGDDFEVIVNSEVAKDNIFYFNSSGHKITHGENEGGFIIIGLENGANTIGILPDKSKQIYTRQVYIDPYAAHYVPFNLNY